MGAVVHGPGEGERHAAAPAEILIKATADDTGGSFYLAEAARSGPLTPETMGRVASRYHFQPAH